MPFRGLSASLDTTDKCCCQASAQGSGVKHVHIRSDQASNALGDFPSWEFAPYPNFEPEIPRPSRNYLLPKTIRDVYSVLDSIKDAPKDLDTLKQDLVISGWILNRLFRSEQLCESADDSFQGLKAILDGFLEVLRDLSLLATEMTGSLAARSTARRQWTKVNWACRAEKVGKLKVRLHDAKLNILLVQSSPYFQSSSLQTAQSIPESNSSNDPITASAPTNSSGAGVFSAPVHDILVPLDHITIGTYSLSAASAIEVEQINTNLSVERLIESTQAIALSYSGPVTQLACSSTVRSDMDDQSLTSTLSLPQPTGDRGPIQVGFNYGKVRLRQIGLSQSTIIRTKFGKLHISATTYRVIRQWDLEDKDPKPGSPAKSERRVSYKFVPHKWVMKLGMKRIFEIKSQVWKLHIQMHSIIPDSSMIFEYWPGRKRRWRKITTEAWKSLDSRQQRVWRDTSSRMSAEKCLKGILLTVCFFYRSLRVGARPKSALYFSMLEPTQAEST
ncbi:hypothetical protein VTL71DRAFT_5268 [Oculimacula yallundae]|uniref:Uncharacterized protein n=1 Tax=Oculimacula yallundae TaxID=86028 RepID=A0ABR4C0L6_9HELO